MTDYALLLFIASIKCDPNPFCLIGKHFSRFFHTFFLPSMAQEKHRFDKREREKKENI